MSKYILNILRLGTAPWQFLAVMLLGQLNVAVVRAVEPINKLPDIAVNTVTDVKQLILCSVAGAMFWILLALSVVLILIAAYEYLTSAGDPEKVSKATKIITYAVVAIVVAFLARGFPAIVGSVIAPLTSITYLC